MKKLIIDDLNNEDANRIACLEENIDDLNYQIELLKNNISIIESGVFMGLTKSEALTQLNVLEEDLSNLLQ